MAVCEKPTLSLLLKERDGTTIAVLVGVTLGAIILSAVSTAIVVPLCWQRPSRRPRLSSVEPLPDSILPPKSTPAEEPFSIPPSLSPTSIRHNVKPPKTFDTDGANTRIPSYPRDKVAGSRSGTCNRFASDASTAYAPGWESNSELTHGDCTVFPFVASSPQEIIHAGDMEPEFLMEGAEITRTKNKPSLKASKDSGVSEVASGYADPSLFPRKTRHLPTKLGRVSRARSESKGPYTVKDQTTLSMIPIPDIRRARAFSSPQNAVNMGRDEEGRVIQMPEYEMHSIKSALPINNHNKEPSADSKVSGVGPIDQRMELVRRLSNSQAASFYKAEAKRHLSMPFIGPRGKPSAVRPDTPGGVIGEGLDPRSELCQGQRLASTSL